MWSYDTGVATGLLGASTRNEWRRVSRLMLKFQFLMKNTILFVILLALGQTLLPAQDAPVDAENCKDSPLITRMPGSRINSCTHTEFDQLKVQMGVTQDGNPIEKTLEGEYWEWDYGTREGVSDLQVFRNLQNALRQGGFKIDYTESPRLITAHKGNTWYKVENSGTYYYQYVLEVKAMKQEVTADASQLHDALEQSGHVAVYGIEFETGKAAILPESEGVLSEVVKLLEQNPALKLRVEGHTDNVGQKAANQALSEKRAQAVAGWLIAHGVDIGRLSAKGFGDSKPVADNTTDEGRAKNRRVELAKM